MQAASYPPQSARFKVRRKRYRGICLFVCKGPCAWKTIIFNKRNELETRLRFAQGNLSKQTIVAAVRVGDELGVMQGLALAREAVELDPTEGDHRQVGRKRRRQDKTRQDKTRQDKTRLYDMQLLLIAVLLCGWLASIFLPYVCNAMQSNAMQCRSWRTPCRR